MKREDSTACSFPGEYAGGYNAVETHFGERPEKHTPVDLALADIKVLRHLRR